MRGHLPIPTIKRYSAAESRAVRQIRQMIGLLVTFPILLLLFFFFSTRHPEFSLMSITLFIAIYTAVSTLLARFIIGSTTDSFNKLILALADLVHESSTPLSNLSSSVQEIGKTNTTIDPLEIQEMQLACDRLLSLHQDLRIISMWGAPLKRSELSILPPALLIESCKNQIARSFASRQMDLEFKNEGGPSIIADASAIKRVVLNLLENSLRYSTEGAKIAVTMGAHGDSLLITLRDYGPGIPDVLLNRIFDRHFRVSAQGKQSEKVEGSGLGLSIAKEIVEAHNGTIAVKNLAPSGVEFTVLLPIAPKQHPFVQVFEDHN